MNGFIEMVQRGNASDVAQRIAVAEGWPTDSWWTRPDFYGNARGELERMKRSRFGRIDMLTMGKTETAKASPPSLLKDEEL